MVGTLLAFVAVYVGILLYQNLTLGHDCLSNSLRQLLSGNFDYPTILCALKGETKVSPEEIRHERHTRPTHQQ